MLAGKDPLISLTHSAVIAIAIDVELFDIFNISNFIFNNKGTHQPASFFGEEADNLKFIGLFLHKYRGYDASLNILCLHRFKILIGCQIKQHRI